MEAVTSISTSKMMFGTTPLVGIVNNSSTIYALLQLKVTWRAHLYAEGVAAIQ